MENEMNFINDIKEMLQIVLTRIDATDTRLKELENVLFNDLLNPIKNAYDKADYDDRLNTFKDTYNEKFAPIEPQVKAVEGEDFDIAKNTFDDYNASDKSMEESEYVDAVVEKVSTQLEDIKTKLNNVGVDAETVTVTADDTGVTVEAKDEDGNVIATEEEITEIVDGEVEEVSNPDELSAFEDELNAEMEKQK